MVGLILFPVSSNTGCALAFLLLQEKAMAEVSPVLIREEGAHVERIFLFTFLPIIIAFSFIVFVFYRTRREAHIKQKEAELKVSLLESEFKAFRAQMSPHFIFNCLNSIHHYMFRSDNKSAGEYLVRFSQLIRHVLESSSSKYVTMADELQALRSYMELEQLRLNFSFKFKIDVSEDIDMEIIQIPPMLLQPFVENAILHGIDHKKTDGEINLSFSLTDLLVRCAITDNGPGNQEKSSTDLSHRVKKTSMGLALVEERLKAINQIYDVKARFEINPSDKGREVEIFLPYQS